MTSPIVGRGREVAELRAAVVSASEGSGRLVLVSGEPGIGKTRLVSAVSDIAAEYDVPIAHGYAVDDAGMPPLWPWRRLMRDFPPFAELLITAAQSGVPESAAARFQMFADVTDALTHHASTSGFVITLDDLHWADRTSLLLLSHLATALDRTRLFVLGTFRPSTDGPLADLLPALLRRPRTRSIRLDGLSTGDIRIWLRELTPHRPESEHLAEQLWDSTGGNPLFVRMLAERMTSPVGDDAITSVEEVLATQPEVRRLALGQLERLGRPVCELLSAASVLGERLDPSLVSAVAEVDPDDVGPLLDQAAAGGVLRSIPRSGGLAFAHSLVRDAVYGDLAPSRRVMLHRRAAIVLEQTDTAGELAGLIASHWQRADGLDAAAWCMSWARTAAVLARRSLAYDEAVRFLELALRSAAERAIGLRAELTLELAQAHFLAGHVKTSLAHCELAARLAEHAGRPDLMAAAGLVVHGIGLPEALATVNRLCESALSVVPEEHIGLRARLLARRALTAAEVGDAERARELSARALEMARSSGDPDAELDGIHARHLAICAPQYVDERLELGRRAVELGATARQPLAALWGHVWRVDAAFQLGDLSAVDVELAHIKQVATSDQLALAWWHWHRLRATRAALVGELEQALDFNEDARRVAERLGDSSTTGMYFAFHGELAGLRGTIDEATAAEALAQLRPAARIPLVRVFVPMVHALGGDLAAAKGAFEEFRDMPRTAQIGPHWAPLLSRIGSLAVLLGDVETAGLVLEKLRGLAHYYMADGSGVVFCGGAMARLIGDLALASGLTEVAIEHHRKAIEMNARIGARPFLALSRLGLAKSLLAHARPEDLPTARQLALSAAAEFRRLDLPGPLADADVFLHQLDAFARSSHPLSAREQEVASLVADALSNREIAERLFLSERTVETHVRNALSKLGYTNRTEIATWALRGTRSRD